MCVFRREDGDKKWGCYRHCNGVYYKKEQMFAKGGLWLRRIEQFLYVRNVDMRVLSGWGSVFAERGIPWWKNA
jgi:hypothetical protein